MTIEIKLKLIYENYENLNIILTSLDDISNLCLMISKIGIFEVYFNYDNNKPWILRITSAEDNDELKILLNEIANIQETIRPTKLQKTFLTDDEAMAFFLRQQYTLRMIKSFSRDFKSLKYSVKSRIGGVMKNYYTYYTTEELLGCTYGALKDWITTQFYEKMDWSNYGSYWELDHTRPIASFDLSDFNQQKVCFNWRNLRPLRINKNRTKWCKRFYFQEVLQELKVKMYLRQN